MKKQILILALLLAGFANVNLSFGQALVPRKVTCLTADALHPIAGTPFTYQIDVPATPAGGAPWTSLKYLWYVTQNQDFIKFNTVTGLPEPTLAADRQKGDGTGILLKTADVAKYNIAGNTSNSISLTWKSFYYDPNAPIFVVISVSGYNGICDPSNLKVFKIEPQNAFTVDIDNLQFDGSLSTPPVYNALGVLQPGGAYGDLYEQCISPIKSAKYNTSTKAVDYDFDQNIMMYEVVAANWYTSWRPSFTLTGVDPKETIKVEFSKDKTFAVPANIVTMDGPANSSATTEVLKYTNTTAAGIVSSVVPSSFVNDAGESIYVRVTLDHSTTTLSYQGLADEKIDLAVDGKTNLGVTATEIGDVHTAAGALATEACPWVDGFANDIAKQALKGRPTITSSTVGVAPNEFPIGNLLPIQP